MKTNEQILKAMLRDLDSIEMAILRERIHAICTITLSQIDTWKPGTAIVVSNEHYKRIIERIMSHVKFEESNNL